MSPTELVVKTARALLANKLGQKAINLAGDQFALETKNGVFGKHLTTVRHEPLTINIDHKNEQIVCIQTGHSVDQKGIWSIDFKIDTVEQLN